MPDVSYPSIPDPNMDLGSVLNTVNRLKETVELITGQRQDKRFSFPNRVEIVERRSAAGTARFTEQLQIQANNLQSIVVRTETLEADLGDVEASVINEATARAAADGALASNITTVQATANGATAGGQVYLVARAAPAGYSAAYGWALTALGGRFVGMDALLDSSGNAGIAFYASQFSLTDPSYNGGVPGNVFSYGSGVFNFNVPVTIRHQEIGINATANGAVAEGLVSSGTYLSTNLTIRENSRVVVILSVSDTSFSVHAISFSTTLVNRYFQVIIDGGSGFGLMTALDTVVASNYLGGAAYQFYAAVTPTSKSFEITGLAEGGHTFAVDNPTGYTLGMSIQVIELARADG